MAFKRPSAWEGGWFNVAMSSLMADGHAHNARGEYRAARSCFERHFQTTGRIEARISFVGLHAGTSACAALPVDRVRASQAANMSLKLGEYDAALREYSLILASGNLHQKVAKLVQSKWEEAISLRRSASVGRSSSTTAETSITPDLADKRAAAMGEHGLPFSASADRASHHRSTLGSLCARPEGTTGATHVREQPLEGFHAVAGPCDGGGAPMLAKREPCAGSEQSEAATSTDHAESTADAVAAVHGAQKPFVAASDEAPVTESSSASIARVPTSARTSVKVLSSDDTPIPSVASTGADASDQGHVKVEGGGRASGRGGAPGMRQVLMWVQSCAKLEGADALEATRLLFEAGVVDAMALNQMSADHACEILPKKLHHKILIAIRQRDQREVNGSRKRARRGGEMQEVEPPDASSQPPKQVIVNRSPVMILWAACIAQIMGYSWAEALSLAAATASLFARAKGRSLGLVNGADPLQSTQSSTQSNVSVSLLGQPVLAVKGASGAIRGLAPRRAPNDGEMAEEEPSQVQRRLQSAFGSHYGAVFSAMQHLAEAVGPALTAGHGEKAYEIYTKFRPNVPPGRMGWGQAGCLHVTDGENSLEHLRASFTGVSKASSQGRVNPPGVASAAAPPLPSEGDACARVLAALAAAPKSLDALAATLPDDRDALRDATETLQLDGAIYECNGRYALL